MIWTNLFGLMNTRRLPGYEVGAMVIQGGGVNARLSFAHLCVSSHMYVAVK